jgi:hypothetical protein
VLFIDHEAYAIGVHINALGSHLAVIPRAADDTTRADNARSWRRAGRYSALHAGRVSRQLEVRVCRLRAYAVK